ncbi:elongation factor P [Pseudodesulfovibrio piezophilus]|uniref:Elongation factor P n=1 Tax=Pseudodesulfovibrio piezophilus (strain DSM 21447 / JCM 15486 / C1TLV30) TaxID=1322246 RepID=M1WLD5_PSEP2|nr:elongation factor P [Pseudodesulfovibrio piezophilus]CCH47675.1 Elongation factor P [Pseudodesulfovibrio piezophilus C1TLV30]
MISTKDFRTGLKIEIDSKPFEIVEFQHFKPGKGGAMIRTKLRQLKTGQMLDKTFRSGEKVKKPDMAVVEQQFIYKDGTDFVFMDLESYEQMNVPGEAVGETGGFIKEGDTVKVLLYNGELIGVDLPANVNLTVTQTDPGVQGDRVSNATKPATMETGLVVQVPLFINEGDVIKVDTRSSEYLGRE